MDGLLDELKYLGIGCYIGQNSAEVQDMQMTFYMFYITMSY